MDKSIIACDLDGTLAAWDPEQSVDEIGEPVPAMMERVRRWCDAGLTVRIFTARAGDPDQIPLIKDWLDEQGLPDLEITNVKTPDLKEIWDDRAVQIVRNTGERADGKKDFNLEEATNFTIRKTLNE